MTRDDVSAETEQQTRERYRRGLTALRLYLDAALDSDGRPPDLSLDGLPFPFPSCGIVGVADAVHNALHGGKEIILLPFGLRFQSREESLDPRYQLTDDEAIGAIRALYARLDKARRECDTLVTHLLNLINVADLGAAGCKRRRDCTCEVCEARRATEGHL